MGWSCTTKAGDTMQKIFDAIARNFGSQNQWEDKKGTQYFWEVGHTEHDDGHISGDVYRCYEQNGKPLCCKSSSIYINPDGSIRRAPASLLRLL